MSDFLWGLVFLIMFVCYIANGKELTYTDNGVKHVVSFNIVDTKKDKP